MIQTNSRVEHLRTHEYFIVQWHFISSSVVVVLLCLQSKTTTTTTTTELELEALGNRKHSPGPTHVSAIQHCSCTAVVKIPLKNSRIRSGIRITTNIKPAVANHTSQPSEIFRQNSSTTFSVMLLTDRHTKAKH